MNDNLQTPKEPVSIPEFLVLQKLSEAGYKPVQEIDQTVLSREQFKGINYSDGAEFEKALLHTLISASDTHSLSDELASKCVDWPSAYHLSPLRSNLLRPFEASLRGKSVLELGAGCGAVTRYLGEIASYVVAVEGSLTRAQANAERCRDLESVSVIAEDLGAFQADLLFDFVVVVGVLEYAALYSEAADPHLQFLERAKQFLAPGGTLLLAIENQLGLKYFAGAPEDHTGQPMQGINDLYLAGGVRTFTLQALSAKLMAGGFLQIYNHSPLPDYKLVKTVVTESGLNHPNFAAGELFAQIGPSDPQLPLETHFDVAAAWGLLNGSVALGELANSFLIEAKVVPSPSLLAEELAFHFGEVRSEVFAREKTFAVDGQFSTGISTREQRISRQKSNDQKLVILHRIESEPQPYLIGDSANELFEEILRSPSGTKDDYLEAMRFFAGATAGWLEKSTGMQVDILDIEALLPGIALDMLPRNAKFRQDRGVEFFDLEWESVRPLTAGYWLFRLAVTSLSQIGRVAQKNRWVGEYRHKPLVELVTDLLKTFGASASHIDQYLKQEFDLVSQVFPWTDRPSFLGRFMGPCLPLTASTIQTQERDDLVQKIEEMHNSLSWRLTSPARKFMGFFVRR